MIPSIMFRTSLLLSLCFVISTQNPTKKPLKVTLIYDPPCPWCKMFINEQLFKNFDEFKDKVQWEVFPIVTQNIENHCLDDKNQNEYCNSFKISMCAIHQICGSEGTLGCPAQKLIKAKNFYICMQQFNHNIDKCANEANIDLRSCINNKRVLGTIVKLYAPKSAGVKAVPYIKFNDKHSEEEQNEAMHDLRSVICRYSPDICHQ